MRALACIAVVLMVTASVYAEDKDKARDAYRRATQHYDLGEFKDALEAFKDAYRNFEDPAFLFNIAQCHRQLGANVEAVHEYRAYLRNLPSAPNREQVRELIAKLEKSIAEEQANKSIPPPGTASPTMESPSAAAVAPKPAPESAALVTAEPAPVKKPIYKRWWLWTAIAGVAAVAVGVGLGVGLTQSSAPSARTDLGTQRF